MVVKEDGEDILYTNGRRIVRKSEVSRIVSNEYDRTKGSGAGKLTYSLKQRFVGLSQKRIQQILNNDQSHYRRNLRFLNKPTLILLHLWLIITFVAYYICGQ